MEGESKPKEENNSKDVQINMEDDMFDVKEEMMDCEESPLPFPNEKAIAEEFVERNLNLFIDKFVYTDGVDSKDFQVESENDLLGMEEEIFDSKDDPLSFSIENGTEEETQKLTVGRKKNREYEVDVIKYCICQKPERHPMIGCDFCNEWYHGSCINLKKDDIKELTKCDWKCPKCELSDSKQEKPKERLYNENIEESSIEILTTVKKQESAKK